MKKIKLTKPEKKACRDVIAFWKKIEKRLLNKEKIVNGWWENKKLVVPVSCPLCDVAWIQEWKYTICENCVYRKAYGCQCFNKKNGHLEKFESNFNLRTCRACIRAIQRILDNAN